MEAMRVTWSDERIDDLSAKVDGTNQRIGNLDREMHAEFRAVRAEMKTMMTTLMATMIGGFVTLFAAILGVMATILTRL
jgi:hypothetical protein